MCQSPSLSQLIVWSTQRTCEMIQPGHLPPSVCIVQHGMHNVHGDTAILLEASNDQMHQLILDMVNECEAKIDASFKITVSH